jgi:hypothetical protein
MMKKRVFGAWVVIGVCFGSGRLLEPDIPIISIHLILVYQRCGILS